MAVLINFKTCDNALECNGVAVCPTGCLTYDENKQSIVIDNKKCISCGKCVTACMVGAIRLAKTEPEFKKIQEK